MKWFRYLILILILIALIDIVSAIYLVKFVIPFGKKISDIIMYSTIVLIIAVFFATGIFYVISKVVNVQDCVIIHPSVYRVFDIISFALFIIYFIMFVIKTNGMERGSNEYMVKMFLD